MHHTLVPIESIAASPGRLARLETVLERLPWLLPAGSFAAGAISFAMVHRGPNLAQGIAVLALLGWPWLLVEPLVRRRLLKWRPRMANVTVNFVSQALQQELLFFALAFMIGATQIDSGQIAFTGLAASAALLSTIDPLYERLIARRAATRLAFHAFCTWITALVVLPIVVRVPLEHALPLSFAVAGGWLLLALPQLMVSLKGARERLAWLLGLTLVAGTFWLARSQVPPAGLFVGDARITRSVEDLVPGAPVRRVPQSDLAEGLFAFTAIRAPAGVAQTVVYEWRHDIYVDRIEAEIRGGRAAGFRSYSRKELFPPDARGRWRIDVLTPGGQLLKRMYFVVE